MKTYKFSFSIFLFLLFFQLGHSQINDSLRIKLEHVNKDTKFGLALSGGGAKGFAHLGILNMIDSLGIKVDYITGTSMGGILGGLYAMGYSSNDLKTAVGNMNWKRILSNKIPYNKVNISEKDEFDKYLIELPVENGFPTLPSSFIEGQYMSEVLNTLTFNAKHINDFSKLRIPVEMTTSDIVNGGLVMQKSGSLPLAIRGTLAIPAAFAPVYIDGKLLVDGGLDRNFPVKEVKDMGADFVIGGYTGFRLFTKKEIENPMKMIYQTHAIRSVEDFKHQKKSSNVLVNFVDILGDITTKDFRKHQEIIKIGENEAKKHLNEFVAIAEAQRKAGIVYEHKMIEEVKKPTIKINYSEDNGTILTNQDEIESIQNLLNLKEGVYHDVNSVNAAVDRVFGTRLYDRVYYTYTDAPDGLIMNIFIKRAKSGAFKVALHYDNEQSVGIILNYTYRNSILNKSRISATVDLAERFKAKIQYQKYIDNNYKFWISAKSEFTNLKSNDYIIKFANINSGSANVVAPNYNHHRFVTNFAINYNLNPNAYATFGAEFNYESINRELVDVNKTAIDNYKKRAYEHNNWDVFFKFEQNNLDKKYFSNSGNNFQFIIKSYFGDHYKINKQETLDKALDEYINPDYDFYTLTKNVTSIAINENYMLPITNKLTLKLNGFLGVHLGKKPAENTLSFLFLNQKFNIGGNEYNFDGFNPEFNGFKQKEIPYNSVAKASASLQYNFYKSLYLIPSFSYGKISDDLALRKDSKGIVGYGMQLAYESLLGPISITASKNDLMQIWRYYFSIGFKF
jgi:NTE family protein